MKLKLQNSIEAQGAGQRVFLQKKPWNQDVSKTQDFKHSPLTVHFQGALPPKAPSSIGKPFNAAASSPPASGMLRRLWKGLFRRNQTPVSTALPTAVPSPKMPLTVSPVLWNVVKAMGHEAFSSEGLQPKGDGNSTDLNPLEQALQEPGWLKHNPGKDFQVFQDPGGGVSLTVVKGDGEKRLFWFDFEQGEQHPLLQALSEKFSFAPFLCQSHHDVDGTPNLNSIEEKSSDAMTFEVPYMDENNIQLTAYVIQSKGKGQKLTPQTLHLYAGESFLVTSHEGKNPSVEKTQRLLKGTGKYKKPSELLSFIFTDIINHYGVVIDSLSTDLKSLSDKVSKNQVKGAQIFDEFYQTEQKIDDVFQNIIRQKRVLKELLELNEFHNSKYVSHKDFQEILESLIHHLEVVDHYQERKNGLINLERAKISNHLDTVMKRIAGIGVLLSPPSLMAGLMGMNVPVPGTEVPGMFWYLTGGAAAFSTGMYALLKRKKWL
ncbi:MAG: magnesium transporter CorA family protein [Cyanobacteria bacterium]|nr:magnesium transporter CorA family protein [Cyanobacteriota bacterium]